MLNLYTTHPIWCRHFHIYLAVDTLMSQSFFWFFFPLRLNPNFGQRDTAHTALPITPWWGTFCFSCGRVWVEQQVCDRSFSPGHGPAAGQISGETGHGGSLPVVYENWAAKMSPFHHRYRMHSSSVCLLSQAWCCTIKTDLDWHRWQLFVSKLHLAHSCCVIVRDWVTLKCANLLFRSLHRLSLSWMIDYLIVCADPPPEAKLCGADIASVSPDLLHTLHLSTVEDRERLLSAIYAELHPPTRLTHRLDALLGTCSVIYTHRRPVKHSPWRLADVSAESPTPCDVETLAEALASMNKSKSSPHVSCLSMGRRSLKLRCTFSQLSELDYDFHHL